MKTVSRKEYDAIEPGDRVSFMTPRGQKRTGTAALFGPSGWVLNMGGPHGTPAVVAPHQVTKVSRRKGRPSGVERLLAFGSRRAMGRPYRGGKKANQREPFWQVFNIYTYSAPLGGMLFHGQVSGKDLSLFEVRRRGSKKFEIPMHQVKIQEARPGEKAAPIQ